MQSVIDLDAVDTYAQQPASSPVRDSMHSLLDLDMGMADPIELERPSTAISTTASQYSDMTSGNPFDLEEDPSQNERDRNRFSYHKQWQSEGGQMNRRSRRSIPMHNRGSSLSSTDAEYESATNGLDRVSLRFSQAGGHTANSSIDLNSWPNFDQAGFEPVPVAQTAPYDHARQQSINAPPPTNGRASSQQNGSAAKPIVTFPYFGAPRTDALHEDASPRTVQLELDRLLRDFGDTLESTSRAMQQHAGIEEDALTSESEGSFESAAGDDNTGYTGR